MLRQIFLDTETTGLEIRDGNRIIEIGCVEMIDRKLTHNNYHQYIKPDRDSEEGALAVHGITTEFLADKPRFADIAEDFLNYIKGAELIIHNAPFDIAILKNEGVETIQFIDTLKVAKHLDSQGIIPEYNLQYLRYYLDIEIPEATAHDAKGDVLVLEEVFKRLFDKVRSTTETDDEAHQKMIELSTKPLLIAKINFGKHKGKTVSDIAHEDAGYLKWLLNQKRQNPDGEEDWIYTLEKYVS